MSCEYCAPKSRMRILSWPAAPAAADGAAARRRSARASPRCAVITLSPLVRLVIRRFLDDLHVVHVGFTHARRGDLDELRALAHRFDAVAAHVAHARAHA